MKATMSTALDPELSPEALKAWRQDWALSQRELADLLGVEPITISRWETGVSRMPQMLVLAVEALTQQRARMMRRLQQQRQARKNKLEARRASRT